MLRDEDCLYRIAFDEMRAGQLEGRLGLVRRDLLGMHAMSRRIAHDETQMVVAVSGEPVHRARSVDFGPARHDGLGSGEVDLRQVFEGLQRIALF